MASYQYVYVMKRLSKIFPGGKKVLEDITLAFLPGAKQDILCRNTMIAAEILADTGIA